MSFFQELAQNTTWLPTAAVLAALWTLPWKGYALWLASKRNQKWWFIILLVVNSLAILEIIYIFFIARRKQPVTTPQDINTPADRLSFDDFQKLDIAVAKIKSAEQIEGSDKLLKLKIEIGDKKRQVVAGIAKSYSPDELLDMKIIVLKNLEPKKLMGVVSEGMLLAADTDDGPVLLIPEKDTPSGAKIR